MGYRRLDYGRQRKRITSCKSWLEWVQAKALFQLLNILSLLVELEVVGTLVEAEAQADIEPHYRLQFQGHFW